MRLGGTANKKQRVAGRRLWAKGASQLYCVGSLCECDIDRERLFSSHLPAQLNPEALTAMSRMDRPQAVADTVKIDYHFELQTQSLAFVLAPMNFGTVLFFVCGPRWQALAVWTGVVEHPHEHTVQIQSIPGSMRVVHKEFG